MSVFNADSFNKNKFLYCDNNSTPSTLGGPVIPSRLCLLEIIFAATSSVAAFSISVCIPIADLYEDFSLLSIMFVFDTTAGLLFCFIFSHYQLINIYVTSNLKIAYC